MPERTQALPPWAQDVLGTLPPLLSRRAAASALGVSAKTVDRRAREGLIETVRAGGRVLIPRQCLVAFLARSR